MKYHLALIGYRGSGKTSLGLWLAKRLAWPCLDTDSLVETATGMSVSEIFSRQGEAAFRTLEAAMLDKALGGPPAVIATGGGIILDEKNRLRLGEACLVVWLTADVETLSKRLQRDEHRPPLTTLDPLEEIRTLMAVREPLYAALADLTLDTGRQSLEVAAGIISEFVQKKTAEGEFLGLPACIDGVADC